MSDRSEVAAPIDAVNLGIVASVGKLYAVWYDVEVAPDPTDIYGLLGVLAILLPVFAVAALSLASARDLKAPKHTYEEMLDFLNAPGRPAR